MCIASVFQEISNPYAKRSSRSDCTELSRYFSVFFSVLACAVIDILARYFLSVPFADILIKLFEPLYIGAESYLGITVIWFLMSMFWFVGVHGPSVVKPAIQSGITFKYSLDNIWLQFIAGG